MIAFERRTVNDDVEALAELNHGRRQETTLGERNASQLTGLSPGESSNWCTDSTAILGENGDLVALGVYLDEGQDNRSFLEDAPFGDAGRGR